MRRNGKVCGEFLNEKVFDSLAHARTVLEHWQHDYNHHRPCSSLGGLTRATHSNRRRSPRRNQPAQVRKSEKLQPRMRARGGVVQNERPGRQDRIFHHLRQATDHQEPPLAPPRLHDLRFPALALTARPREGT
ncbi:integrase core domain-containing protein [Hyphomonas sp.]|uniref:integrase core domain-containing protein n=1 Tax=Hyphomonas sp. TaxID=87 RepID=UPI003D2AE8E7